MELNEIFKYLNAAWIEICARKFKAALILTLSSFAILSIGMLNSAMFSSNVTIYADTQNVIKPLLGKQTEVTRVKQNRATQIKDIIYSPRQLTKVMNKIYGENAFPTPSEKENKLSALRKNLTIKSLSGNYIKIAYQDKNADRTFRLLNEVVTLFIEDSTNTKRKESRSAFEFISQQVESYKQQLLSAENNLKSFKSSHLDGTEDEVERRISVLRTNIEDLKIQKMESIARIASLKKQLSSQEKFSINDYEASLYHSRLKEQQQHLANLLLIYKDDYPAVIETRYQISDAKKAIENLSKKEKTQNTRADEFNPLYTEISSKLSTAKVEQMTINNRLTAFDKLLIDAYQRRKRIANNQAELAELNRDNNVTKALYEDMLANKEKARLSMVLDIEGQGVNYKIQEPAIYPTLPSGPRFLHFFLGAPIISLLLLFSVFIIKITFDNKIRFTSQLQNLPGNILLATIHHQNSPLEQRKRTIQNILLTLYALLIMAVYLSVSLMYKYDLSAPQLLTLWR